ncbi:MAG: hypothetical protein K2J70_07510 [Muribaculaceae bacterium]|nr:hypothetical protein [Muribaculaceae bacterium]
MDKRKISLKDLYDEKKRAQSVPPAKQMLNDLMEATGRSEVTVRQWIIGKFKPEPIICKIIADKLNIDPAYLFPEKEVPDGN